MIKQSVGIDEDIVPYRKQLIPDAFTVQPLPTAANFESLLNTLITKVHAAAQGLDTAREWIAKVKRDPDISKYESAETFEALGFSIQVRIDEKVEPIGHTKGTCFGMN